MSDIFNNGQEWTSYQHKLDVLQINNVGLWDALKACDRNGSLDTNIKNAVPNNFSQYKYIPYFLFNGKKAFELFKRYNKTLLQENNYILLPSTSPTNATISYETKLSIWKSAVLLFNMKSK